jgi:four helix bundle protein
MKPSALQDKSYAFAVRIVQMCRFLTDEKREFVLSRQVLRSGTSIGANIAESAFAQSPADFISKLSISAKESHETKFWLRLLCDTGYITPTIFESLHNDLVEVQKLLTASLKTAKLNTRAA